ncbi:MULTISPECIES: hypothetical protein [Actinomadura]|uniref:Uncharacterized protein n=1 Tax=Actinomadura madurae TaxID=1993 RepID=A0A1I5BY81_9ACTN|nr:hypothetical protein [Actinomadura madurae]SFN79729.1 hypothetical protein SAMN04489713_10372 [Actinomadura madurae]SPT50888.1 Uncharacterised protein [Actinomadura madurae]
MPPRSREGAQGNKPRRDGYGKCPTCARTKELKTLREVSRDAAADLLAEIGRQTVAVHSGRRPEWEERCHETMAADRFGRCTLGSNLLANDQRERPMVRPWPCAGLAVVLAACLLAPSSTVRRENPPVEDYVTEQLTVAARAYLQRRSQALVQKGDRDRGDAPTEIQGVRISPRLVRSQESAVRELEARSRAPVEGGPAYTGARTSLDGGHAFRTGDRITLEAVEHTEMRYGSGKVTQSVRRRFVFRTRGEQITLVGERVLDPGAHPVNDPVDDGR